ncbi:YdbL family protein [Silanimonas lenta]|uniref:YdbL family protein n=1 Tax=Silanimonas lenta TaxID=265429 RepID=UPI00041F03AE|nr:YdbL family protein [Silanimonas lenta]
MRKPLLLAAILLPFFLLASCVTINVYFPAAEAQQAAKEFVEDVIGETPANAGGGSASVQREALPQWVLLRREWRFDPVGVFIGSAHAQERADITIRTPAIQAIQQRMAERFQSTLAPLFDSGALGFGNDGLVVLRDPAKVPLAQRTAATQAVADENRDRRAVYREIAVANGKPEWEEQIRQTFAREWVAQARPGWWYQDSAGNWKQK